MNFNRIHNLDEQRLDIFHWLEIDFHSGSMTSAMSQIADEFYDGYNLRWWHSFFAYSIALNYMQLSYDHAKCAGYDVFE